MSIRHTPNSSVASSVQVGHCQALAGFSELCLLHELRWAGYSAEVGLLENTCAHGLQLEAP